MHSADMRSTSVVFAALALYNAYLYSIGCESLPWGHHEPEPLYMLTYFLTILPLMILVYVIRYKSSKKGYLSVSMPLYIVLTFILACNFTGNFGSVAYTLFAMVSCLVIAILSLGELFFIRPTN